MEAAHASSEAKASVAMTQARNECLEEKLREKTRATGELEVRRTPRQGRGGGRGYGWKDGAMNTSPVGYGYGIKHHKRSKFGLYNV